MAKLRPESKNNPIGEDVSLILVEFEILKFHIPSFDRNSEGIAPHINLFCLKVRNSFTRFSIKFLKLCLMLYYSHIVCLHTIHHFAIIIRCRRPYR